MNECYSNGEQQTNKMHYSLYLWKSSGSGTGKQQQQQANKYKNKTMNIVKNVLLKKKKHFSIILLVMSLKLHYFLKNGLNQPNNKQTNS